MGTPPKQTRQKLDGILQAIAAGRSCEQILAEDRTLCYHDIFHAIAEAPTSHWEKSATENPATGLPSRANLSRTPAKQRAD
jgi:hypothetical protein